MVLPLRPTGERPARPNPDEIRRPGGEQGEKQGGGNRGEEETGAGRLQPATSYLQQTTHCTHPRFFTES